MASSNELIVRVLGDTSKLTKSLNDAQTQINRFAGKSKLKSTGADAFIASIQGSVKAGEELVKTADDVQRRTDELNRRFARTGAGALAVGLAVNIVGRNMQELGGNVGKLGGALSDLSTGNLVGFVKGLQSINETDPKKMAADLLKFGDAAKATDTANRLAAAGFDKLAEAARGAAAGIRAATDAFVDPTKIRDSPSPGSIADEVSGIATPKRKKRPGITASQRNTFFDNDLTRSLDRVQDSKLRGQVTELTKIAATIQARIAVTKDITRKLNLEDQLQQVVRQRQGVQDEIAKNLADNIAKQNLVKLARLQIGVDKSQLTKGLNDDLAALNALKSGIEKQIAAGGDVVELQGRLVGVIGEIQSKREEIANLAKASVQRRQFKALGFAADGSEIVPTETNLRKQINSLTKRLASSASETGVDVTLNSKLKSKLEGARKVLSGQFGTLTRESRDHIAQLFDTIRGEFDKQGKGPLTKATQINSERILAGLGLSTADERQIRARLSHFNSAGSALRGSGSGSMTVQSPPVYLDGVKISKNTSKHQTRGRKLNPVQRNGPHAGWG